MSPPCTCSMTTTVSITATQEGVILDHKERMLAILYDKKVPDKVPHGDVTVDPKIGRPFSSP